MEHDHKYSGTLPLLAYAPQDFGQNACRARAYRARAAMGRTGVQPLRSHAQAAALTSLPAAVKPAKEQSQPAQTSLLFTSLWARISRLFGKTQNPVPAQPVSRSIPAGAQSEDLGSHAASGFKLAPEQPVVAVGSLVDAQQQTASEPAGVSLHQTVSSTYAAMRLKTASVIADDQSIPQSPDLAHALAEIRQALREHEKLATAKLNNN